MASTDVIVVGGGLSGLIAATKLTEKGYSVLVLEANDRPGGRLCRRESENGFVVDVGGQWVGPSQSRLLRLAEQLNIRTYRQYMEGKTILDAYGKITKYAGMIPPVHTVALIDLQLAMWDIDKKAFTVPLDAPWECPNAKEWDSMTVETYMEKRFWTETAKMLLRISINAIFACEPNELSLLFALFYIHSAGGLTPLIEADNGAQQDKFVGGAAQIPLRLAETLGNKVILNSPVRFIDQQSEDGWVTVRTDNASYKSRYLIMACPPPIASRIHYQPQMPINRDQLCQRMPMAHAIKLLIFFKTPFWRKNGLNGTIVSDRGPLAVTYDGSSEDHPHLVSFLFGNTARELGSKSVDERLSIILDQLAIVFGVTAEFIREQNTEFIEKDWASEQYIRGGYLTLMTPGALTSCGKALREPVGRIHFAGTETAMHWSGYMEGAIDAGERAAAEVQIKLQQIQDSTCG